MSKQQPDIDRIYRQRFDGWEAPHQPGEAQSVFEQVQQHTAQPGNGGPSTGSGGSGSSFGSGAQGLLGGLQGWLVTGVTALLISGGIGYFSYNMGNNAGSEKTKLPKADSTVEQAADKNKTAKTPQSSHGQEDEEQKHAQKTPEEAAEPLSKNNRGHSQQSGFDNPNHPENQKGNNSASSTKPSSSLNQKGEARSDRPSQAKATKEKSATNSNSRDNDNHTGGDLRIVAFDTVLCPYEKLRFTVEGLSDTHKISYKLGDQPFKTVQGRRQEVELPGGVGALLLIAKTRTPELVYDTQRITITQQPKSAFNVQKPGPHEVRLKAKTSQSINHQWLLGNGEQRRTPHLTYTYPTGGTKTIKLVTSGKNGCMDTAMKRIRLKPAPEVDLPNIFTPNGDGRNDRLVVTHGKLDSFILIIKNQQGQIVFETRDPERTWNGKVKNSGTQCNEGAYSYVLRYKYPFHPKIHQQSGKLLLKRSDFR